MLRPSLLLCAVAALALPACSSSDSASQTHTPVDSGTPSQDAQPDSNETPEAAAPETSTEDAVAESGGEEAAAEDAPADVTTAEAGTKKAGEFCTEAWECADSMNCVSGQYTPAHCNPNCASDADCAASAPGAKGACQAAGGGVNFCLYYCGVMGGTCPGDLTCDGAVCS